MLVIFRHLAQAMVLMLAVVVVAFMPLVVMVVPRLGLHSLHIFLFQQLHTVHHFHHGAGGLHGVQDGVHPGVGLAAQVNEQVAVPHRQDVRRRRLVGMGLRARRQQQRHIRQLSGRGPGKIIGRKHSGHDLHPVRVLGLRRLAAAAQQQAAQDQNGQAFFHWDAPYKLRMIFICLI